MPVPQIIITPYRDIIIDPSGRVTLPWQKYFQSISETSAGAGNLIGYAKYKTASTNDTTGTLTADADITGITLSAGNYTIVGSVWATSASATPDLQLALNCSSAPTAIDVTYTGINLSTSAIIATSRVQANNTTSGLIPIAANQTVKVDITGYVVSTGGTIQLKWAQNSANATPTTLQAGSWLRVIQV